MTSIGRGWASWRVRRGARYVLNGTIVQAGLDLRIDARVEDFDGGAVRVSQRPGTMRSRWLTIWRRG